MTYVAAGVAAAGVGVSIYTSIHNSNKAKKLQRAQNKAIDNKPTYNIAPEVGENQAIAKSQAFGRDRSIQMQQENISQEAENSTYDAARASNSTSGLLSTIAAINANRNQNLRGLAQDEASLQNNKRQQLYGVNSATIDEKDKAWNYNSNMPYQMKIAALRDQIQYRREASSQAAGSAASIGTTYAGSDSASNLAAKFSKK